MDGAILNAVVVSVNLTSCLCDNSPAQLAAAFVINLGFLMRHVGTNAFKTDVKTDEENRAQFNGLISILLVLFSGIVLRFDELNKLYGLDSGGDYDSMMISGVLIVSQAAVMVMFLSKMVQSGTKANGMQGIKGKALDLAAVAAIDGL